MWNDVPKGKNNSHWDVKKIENKILWQVWFNQQCYMLDYEGKDNSFSINTAKSGLLGKKTN